MRNLMIQVFEIDVVILHCLKMVILYEVDSNKIFRLGIMLFKLKYLFKYLH